MKRPYGQVRSGQYMSCKVIWFWKYIYNVQRAMQKLPIKLHVNRAIELRDIIVDTQIAQSI